MPGGGFTIGSGTGTPSGGLVNIDFTTQTGQVVRPELFGVSMSTSNGTWGATFGDPNWVATMASLDIRHVRFQGEGIVETIFGGGTTPGSWNAVQPLIDKINVAFPHATFMWTGVDSGSTIDPNTLASELVQFFQHLDNT